MLLKVENLTKRFGGLVAVSDVSFAYRKGRDHRHLRAERVGQDHAAQPAGRVAAAQRRAACSGKAGISPARGRTSLPSMGVIKTFQNPQLFSELSRVRARHDREFSRLHADEGSQPVAEFPVAAQGRGDLARAGGKGADTVPAAGSSAKPRRRIVLWRGKDARRRDGDDVRAGDAAARRTGVRARQRRNPESGKRAARSARRTEPRCASSTTRWHFSPSLPTRPSHFNRAARSPKAVPRRAGRSRRGQGLSGAKPSCLSFQPSTLTTPRTRCCARSICAVDAGEVVALIGANAAGKSTTMRLIAGLKRATSGSIKLDGVEIESLSTPKRVRLGIALVPEGRQVFAQSTVLENLTMGAYHRPDRNDIQHDHRCDVFDVSAGSANVANSAPARCPAANSRWSRSRGD